MFEGFHYTPREKAQKRMRDHEYQTPLQYVIKTVAPFMRWLPQYNARKYAQADITAGLTVAAILIPQAMAYAFLVGLPPQMGLYAAMPAVALAALFGSSRYVITGPVGIVSLLTITVLLPFAKVGSPEYIALAITLALGVGIVQTLLGVFKFGFLVRLIPHSVLIGFSSAAAIIIGSTQVPALMGFKIEQQEHVFSTFLELIKAMPQIHILTFIIGISAFIFIYTLKYFKPAAPASLMAIVAGLISSYMFDFKALGISVVGNIPATIPIPSFNGFDIHALPRTIINDIIVTIRYCCPYFVYKSSDHSCICDWLRGDICRRLHQA